MLALGLIPARYNSSRFPGKPLAMICGKPMVWWVYAQAKKSKKISEVYIATDDERIEKACREYEIPCIMTSSAHGTSTERLFEVSEKINADVYVCINGDEPLINPDYIDAVIPDDIKEDVFVSNLMCEISDPVELIDSSNIKVVVDKFDNALFFSRSPIPYPKASLEYSYFKHVGVLSYNKKALKLFNETSKGTNEKIEDINELRFLEMGVKIKMIRVKKGDSLSVDTPKDLERVIDRISSILA
ncbi:MAG: 3-deoxy-manno-octulosonate cytidylyltransferase [Alcaligenes sp.]